MGTLGGAAAAGASSLGRFLLAASGFFVGTGRGGGAARFPADFENNATLASSDDDELDDEDEDEEELVLESESESLDDDDDISN